MINFFKLIATLANGESYVIETCANISDCVAPMYDAALMAESIGATLSLEAEFFLTFAEKDSFK